LPRVFILARIFLWQNYRLRSAKKISHQVLFFGASRLHRAAKRANRCTPIRFGVASRDRWRRQAEHAASDFQFQFLSEARPSTTAARKITSEMFRSNSDPLL
jgi:hypothetical protein